MLENAKAKFLGNFILQSEDKTVAARRALTIKTNDLPEDFYKNYIANINKVTVEDVQRVANKYFSDENARIVLVGKAADVLENVENIEWNGQKLPVKFFDKDANPTDRPETITLPEGVTLKTVMAKYIDAIGGMEKVNSVNSILLQYEASAMGSTIMSEEKRIDGKTAQNIYMNGAQMMAVVTTKEEAYMKQGGAKNPLPGNMAEDMKPMAGLFMELNLMNSETAKVSGIESVDGKDAYRVDVPGEVVSMSLFYDVESGLKVKEVQITNMNGRSQNQEATLSDYQDYDGLMFPATRQGTQMGQQITFKLKEVKINEGVTEADFD